MFRSRCFTFVQAGDLRIAFSLVLQGSKITDVFLSISSTGLNNFCHSYRLVHINATVSSLSVLVQKNSSEDVRSQFSRTKVHRPT